MCNNQGYLGFLFPVSHETLNQFLTQFSHGVICADENGKALYANRKAEQTLGYESGEIYGKPLDTFLVLEDRPKHNSILHDIANNTTVTTETTFEPVAVNKEGLEIPISISYNLLQEDGQKLIVCLIQDIHQQVNLQKELYQQAITDSLTGLYNRRYFDQRLFEEFTRASRYCRPFSVIIIDIDGFKQANDLYGHSFGDQMLGQATDTFKQVLREGDSIYRYGGDEFAMLLPETTKEGGIEVADRLKNMFVASFSGNEKRIRLSLSIGVASYPEDGTDEKSLISAADRRMYTSKESGGNMVTAYDEVDYLNNDTGQLLRSLGSLVTLMEKNRGHNSHGLGHSQNIRTLAIEIAHRIGLDDERIALLEQASMLHDIGNITLPGTLFAKKTSLTETERLEIRRHTLAGEEIINMLDPGGEHVELTNLKRIIGQHHERLDGSGYPRGLKGDDICIEARILAAADSYQAMTSNRPYRAAMAKGQALAELQELAANHNKFDTDVVSHLVQIETSH